MIVNGRLEEALNALADAVKKLGPFPQARSLNHRLRQAIGKK